MKKRLLIVVLVVVVFSLLVACGDSVRTWEVTKSTGLYVSIDPDSEMITALSVGTTLKATGEDGVLICRTNDEDMELCHIEVVDTGGRGWVLRKWID